MCSAKTSQVNNLCVFGLHLEQKSGEKITINRSEEELEKRNGQALERDSWRWHFQGWARVVVLGTNSSSCVKCGSEADCHPVQQDREVPGLKSQLFHACGVFHTLVGKTSSVFPEDPHLVSEIVIALEQK